MDNSLSLYPILAPYETGFSPILFVIPNESSSAIFISQSYRYLAIGKKFIGTSNNHRWLFSVHECTELNFLECRILLPRILMEYSNLDYGVGAVGDTTK